MILITSSGEFSFIIFFYFTVSFFFSFISLLKKKKVAAGLFCVVLCCLLLLQESIFSGSKILKAWLSGKIDCDQMEEGEQYSEYLVERNPRSYMSMRDYRNLPWQWQQPVKRNPNPRSMREYRDQWMSTPSYMVPSQYTSTPHPPQPPQLISPVEKAILDLTKLVGDAVVEQKKFNAQLRKKIHAVENPFEQKLDGFQSEMGKQFDSRQCSISMLA